MQHPLLDNVIWATAFFGHILLLAIIVFHRYYKLLPVFTTYMAYNIARAIFLFPAYKYLPHHTYYIVYWSAAVPDYLLQFGILYEITRNLLSTNESRREIWRSWKLWLAILFSISATILIICSIRFEEAKLLSKIIETVDLTVSVLRTLLFTSIVLLSGALSSSLKNLTQRVATGLAIFSIIDLVSTYEFAIYHDRWLVYYQSTAYLISLGYWIGSFIIWPQFLVLLTAALLLGLGYWRRMCSKHLSSWGALTAEIRDTAEIHQETNSIRGNLSSGFRKPILWPSFRNLADLYHNAGVYAKLADYASQHASGIPPAIIEELYTEATQVRLLILSAMISRLTHRLVPYRLNSLRALELYAGMKQHVTALLQESCPQFGLDLMEVL